MFDYHVHSSFSGDSPAPDRVQIMAASYYGLKELCFTNHLDIDFPYAKESGKDFELDIPMFLDDFAALEDEFSGSMNLKAGVEVGLQMHILDDLKGRLAGQHLDYVLASLHLLKGFKYDMHKKESWKHYTKDYVFRQYILQFTECLRKFDDYDCLGHLTYFSRYYPYEDKMMHYADAAEELDALFKLIIQKGKGLEINTSVYRRFGFMVPDYDIVKRFRELGGEIVVTGSDAHLPNFIGANFKEAYDMLKQAGFKYVCTFDKREPVFNKI